MLRKKMQDNFAFSALNTNPGIFKYSALHVIVFFIYLIFIRL